MPHLKFKTLAVLAAGALLGGSLFISLIASPAPALAAAVSPGVSPGPNDARIAYVTARLLEEFHYLQQPLDAEMSERFFDGYLAALDPRREYFLE